MSNDLSRRPILKAAGGFLAGTACTTLLGSNLASVLAQSTLSGQTDWRYCYKCQVMFFNGYLSKGSCAAGGGHDAAGYNFILPHDVPGTPTAQTEWRYCYKCQAMFFNGYPSKGYCPTGGGHDVAGYNFALPHLIPGQDI